MTEDHPPTMTDDNSSRAYSAAISRAASGDYAGVPAPFVGMLIADLLADPSGLLGKATFLGMTLASREAFASIGRWAADTANRRMEMESARLADIDERKALLEDVLGNLRRELVARFHRASWELADAQDEHREQFAQLARLLTNQHATLQSLVDAVHVAAARRGDDLDADVIEGFVGGNGGPGGPGADGGPGGGMRVRGSRFRKTIIKDARGGGGGGGGGGLPGQPGGNGGPGGGLDFRGADAGDDDVEGGGVEIGPSGIVLHPPTPRPR